MKQFSDFLFILSLIGCLTFLSCNKDDVNDLRVEILSMESRISSIEDWIQTANKNISDLQILTVELSNSVTVSSISELSYGYEIQFSNGRIVTLKNGIAGHSPSIGVRKGDDNTYYWTLDGEWLLDSEGKRLRVTGKDGSPGTNGITPEFKIDGGYWFVSTNKGISWTPLGKATGEDGKQGSNGDSFFKSVTYDDYYVYVTLNDGTELLLKRKGKDVAIIAANDLSADLSLDSFPRSNKFGDNYFYGCRVISFSGIKICKGYQSYRANWFEIDNTKVILKFYENSTVIRESVAHGLTITKMLNVNINVTSEGKAILTIQTLGGAFTHTFDGWGYNANGILQVKNEGSIVSDCSLSATNNYFICPIWFFGASYEGVSKNRWPGQMKALGYFNFLLNGYAGRNGATTIADIKRALNYGRPKYIYYSGSNDSSDSTYKKNLNNIIALCNEMGITLVTYYRPDIPDENYSARRVYLLETGCRYINGEFALHDPNKVWSKGVNTWYDGFLSSDNKHPTVLGAKALAMQFLRDFPEIMQYSLKDSNSYIPDYAGGDN